jgi:hypothetical protein
VWSHHAFVEPILQQIPNDSNVISPFWCREPWNGGVTPPWNHVLPSDQLLQFFLIQLNHPGLMYQDLWESESSHWCCLHEGDHSIASLLSPCLQPMPKMQLASVIPVPPAGPGSSFNTVNYCLLVPSVLFQCIHLFRPPQPSSGL